MAIVGPFLLPEVYAVGVEMKLAFVIPFYGKDIPGGAEALCRQLTEDLSMNGYGIEVLTTCLKDSLSDMSRNYFTEGDYDIGGVKVKRFRVVERKETGDLSFVREVLSSYTPYPGRTTSPLSPEEEIQWIQSMAYSPDLCDYISRHHDDYDYFVFLPYLFGTTYYGMMVRPEKSILIPCTHDEGYAYLKIFGKIARMGNGIVFNSESEKHLYERLYGPLSIHTAVIGVGIDPGILGSKDRFAKKFNVLEPFLLYVGKKDVGKNTPLLLEYFRRYRERKKSPLRLVLIGGGDTGSAKGQDFIDLGYLSEQDKADAYKAAFLFCQPSVKESFSIVIMEAWREGIPVIVNEKCTVLMEHCLRSNGGLYFGDYADFEGCLEYFLENPDIRRRMGDKGKEYVLSNYTREKILRKFVNFLSTLS